MQLKSVVAFLCVVLLSCSIDLQPQSGHQQMVNTIKKIRRENAVSWNVYDPGAKLRSIDSSLRLPDQSVPQRRFNRYRKARALLELGREPEAVDILENIILEKMPYDPPRMKKDLALAYLRLGERSNCISSHAAESCILPIKGAGLHRDQHGSQEAIRLYQDLLNENPEDLESRWLLNIAYMTIGRYPGEVPDHFLIPGLDVNDHPEIKPFVDIAGSLKVDVKSMSGGSITDDFNNDGYLDIVTSGWGLHENIRFFMNNKNGTFIDQTGPAGLKGIAGGLNIMQTDYNNDGYKDIFVLRGAWKRKLGKEPNSLLRNNGDDTFTDVTASSGLLSFHPTQTATWNDFNNDGWLDLFIGNESVTDDFAGTDKAAVALHPCELYINNQDGTFREIATKAGCDKMYYVKGVTSGDFDNDGWKDIYLSTMDGHRMLLKNNGIRGDEIAFEDVTIQAGLHKERGSTFPTWFWDYDNDGWLDIFVCDYSWDQSLAHYAALENLGMPTGNAGKMILYRNNGDGTFTNTAAVSGLSQIAFAMGSNFGDIDNDGFLDMYLGTGNPQYQSVIPNKMFRNNGGKIFEDITASARVGHLQKGHGVSFADMDNDGDQDLYVEMGGALPGDAYQNSFFMNPGQGKNNWICLNLEGVQSNRAAIGSRIKITVTENGRTRNIFRDVNAGGSFGSSPLRREIGVGSAKKIDTIEIRWHGSNRVQVFHDMPVNQFLAITEGNDALRPIELNVIQWTLPDKLCSPEAVN